MRLAHGDVLLFTTPRADDFLFRHLLFLGGLLAYADGLTRPAAGAGVGPGPLAPDRQPTAMAEPAVGTDFHQALDVQRDFATQLALDFGFFVDHVAEAADLLVVEILDSNVG